VAQGPSDDELLEFVDLMLSNLDRELREPDVLAKAVSDNREMWVMLYRASHGLDDSEPSHPS
jgi:hypothetical protein